MRLVSLATSNGAYGVSNQALGIDDDIQRRDSLHAIINNLPDPHYATLRALILVRIWRNQASRLSGRMRLTKDLLTRVMQHLNKVQEHYATNRMNAGNLAICFG